MTEFNDAKIKVPMCYDNAYLQDDIFKGYSGEDVKVFSTQLLVSSVYISTSCFVHCINSMYAAA